MRTIGAVLTLLLLFTLASCANTVRGIGQDVEETAEAVEDLD